MLTDELLLAGALNVEKKLNPLVGGATRVSACFGRFFGVFTVISSLEMLGLCTRRKEVSSSSASDNTPVKILERLSCLQAPLIQLNPGLNNALAINKLREYFCLQRENPISKRATLIVVCFQTPSWIHTAQRHSFKKIFGLRTKVIKMFTWYNRLATNAVMGTVYRSGSSTVSVNHRMRFTGFHKSKTRRGESCGEGIDLYMHTHLFVAVQCDSGRCFHCYWRGSWFSDFRT